LTVLKNAQRQNVVDRAKSEGYQPTVSVLIPAHNEGKVIGTILERMTEMTYPKDRLQVIVIDDGSTDDTGRVAALYSKRFDYIEVIRRDREHGGRGKAAVLNAGTRRAKSDIILFFDADYYPQKDIIEKFAEGFTDPKVGAVQGRVTVLNEPINIVTRLVALERIGGYRVDQQAREELGLIPQFGGTAGAVRRSLLERIGGWDESILAEDTDLTFRVSLEGFKVRYINDAECYEEAVESWRAYWKQRHRWSLGHMQVFCKYWVKVLKSSNLGLRKKIDGLLLLGVYFVPVLVLFSWIIGVLLLFLEPSDWFRMLWALMPFSFYSCVGNFAPFFEVGTGVHLDGRRRVQWLIPLLIFTFFYNVPICTKAFADLILSKAFGTRLDPWSKTTHLGDGNCYVMKQNGFTNAKVLHFLRM